MQFLPVFPDIPKIAKNVEISKAKGVYYVSYVLFGYSLHKV